jgi:hypothetical protein
MEETSLASDLMFFVITGILFVFTTLFVLFLFEELTTITGDKFFVIVGFSSCIITILDILVYVSDSGLLEFILRFFQIYAWDNTPSSQPHAGPLITILIRLS